jgi:dUTP pyrophosphatase
MEVVIKLFDQSLPLPEYKSTGAAALDLYSRLDMTIAPASIGYVPLNVALQVPADHFVLLSARSSLHKKGLLLANGIGIGDYDYRGDQDEYVAALYNFSKESVQIEKGERLVQMIVLRREPVILQVKQQFADANRGGFGSTGRK